MKDSYDHMSKTTEIPIWCARICFYAQMLHKVLVYSLHKILPLPYLFVCSYTDYVHRLCKVKKKSKKMYFRKPARNTHMKILTSYPTSISLYFVFVQNDKIRTVFTKKVDESEISGRVINSKARGLIDVIQC